MNTRYLLPFLTLIALAGATTARADSYKIDPVHSMILFKIGHLGVGKIYGRFDSFSGDITFDQDDPSKDAVNVEIKTDSVDTNAANSRDKDIKGPDFFNAAQFPTATFKGKSFKKIDDKTYEITGDFTLRGVTKPLTLKTTLIGTGPGPKGETRSGAEATGTLKRSDFDVKAFLPAVSDEVDLIIAVEAIKQ
jgi:polyisoprenoid-binding protein YceI